ncbi:cruciform cutting endonuclease [Scheffersomyces amazonensis]|uniref:cruciform cutting endonuclease n=1 Tax=Scheffersomyces amazonensis TaxID=1078765 RepID=UPI00315C52D5
MIKKYADILSSYKVSTLHQIGLISGLPIVNSTKQGRIESLVNGLNLQSRVPQQNINILSIDVGIKNFSYCQVNGLRLNIDSPSVVSKWAKIDLNEEYGSHYEPIISLSSPLDSKRYINYFTQKLANDLVQKSNIPDIIVMETQRTRSNNNSITLPNVLLNYTFENILYSNLYNKLPTVPIIPMASTSMINFWFNRFVTKQSLKKFSTSKKSRLSIFFNWMEKKSLFTLPGWEDIDHSLSIPKKTKLVLAHLGLESNDKIDDLIDSLFYNLTIKRHLQNQSELINLLNQDDFNINHYIVKHNVKQLMLVKDIIEEFNLQLIPEYQSYVDFFQPLKEFNELDDLLINDFIRLNKM